MDINVGDIWKDNEGSEVIITCVGNHIKFPGYPVRGLIYDSHTGATVRTYTLKGKYDRYMSSSPDLVEYCGNVCTPIEPITYIPPASNDVEKDVENDNCGRPDFQVGDVYRSSDNTMFLIVNIDDPVNDDDLYVVSGIMLDGEIPEQYSWTLTGVYLYPRMRHPYDLEEKIKNVLDDM